MRRLVVSSLDRWVTVGGRDYKIPPPTVRTACEIVASARGALSGQGDDREVFRDAARRWLPAELFKALGWGDEAFARSVPILLAFVLDGAPETRRKAGEVFDRATGAITGDPLAAFAELPVDEMLADYAGAYGADPARVYERVPFPTFLVFHRLIDRVYARRSYEQIIADALPHIEDDSEREEAIRKLTERAGLTKPKAPETPEETIERQKRVFGEIEKLFGPGSADNAVSAGATNEA